MEQSLRSPSLLRFLPPTLWGQAPSASEDVQSHLTASSSIINH